MAPLRASTTKSEYLPDDPTGFVPSRLWKLPSITTWDDSRNQNHPTDSAEEADFNGKRRIDDSYEYKQFSQMRAAVKVQAELIAVSYASRADLTYGSDLETEKAYVQNVSGWMFASFGLRPAVGGCSRQTTMSRPARIRTRSFLTTIGGAALARTRE